MAEDFGFGGDESFLDYQNFALELNQVRGWQYEAEQREMAALNEAGELDGWREVDPENEDDLVEFYEPEDCPLDGDAESALASCGWGTDEDYGGYGGDDEW